MPLSGCKVNGTGYSKLLKDPKQPFIEDHFIGFIGALQQLSGIILSVGGFSYDVFVP